MPHGFRWAAVLVSATLAAQTVPRESYQALRWRSIGPFRAGRTVGAVGVRSQPGVFYIGVNNGGVWRTTDYGRTWVPLFDEQPTGSIGDIAVCQANPQVLYAGSGEGLQRPDLATGDGIYKSTDGGKTWRNVGLRDAQQIGGLIVDPRNPDRVFVAALGHPYGPNLERGVYRTLNGGQTWERVLYRDENTGAIQVEFDPQDPNTLYADLWAARQGPWENGAWQGSGSGLYKSTDGGTTWRQLSRGLPTIEQGLGRIGFGIVHAYPRILYALADANPAQGGLYRSDDAGETWRRVNSDPRIWGRGSDFAEVRPHPKNPEIVFVANTASYRSTDGGKTFTGFKGAPGGDDYHRIWIHPDTPDVMLFATDQGATITVNGGATWSSWYNQPTAQFYHVITDNRFPYWVYGGQQESGSAAVASRGDHGAITWRDWQTVGVEEYGYVAPDPLDPNIIYGGKITRFDRRTGQVQNIAPEVLASGKYRFLRTAPVLFSPVNPRALYYAGNVLFRTLTGGQSWEVISPDLSRETWDVPESIGIYRTPEMRTMPRRGVIYTIALSFRNEQTIWAGTDDGLIHITRDGGKTWTNVTPPELTSWSKVSLIAASPFDDQSAYAAINRLRLDDLSPLIQRTHDGGKTWQRIVTGIPGNETVNAVREDPVRKGLLYAATERAVHFSLDDGEHWNPLRLNMPATSVRDLVVHRDDLVVGTHGRGFWILDNITPLRQPIPAATTLLQPATAWRVRRSVNTDTPIPWEEPMGQNPPDGAMIDYYLKSDAPAAVVLEIFDSANRLVRKFSSTDPPDAIDPNQQPYPSYWFRPARILSAKAGLHRWVWDLRYPRPEGFPRSYPMTAIYGDTPPEPNGPVVLPGDYTVRLSVDGQTMVRKLTVRMDPRVATTPAGLRSMFDVSHGAWEGIRQARSAQAEIRTLAAGRPAPELAREFAALAGESGGGRRRRSASAAAQTSLESVAGDLFTVMTVSEGADVAPSSQLLAASADARKNLDTLLGRLKTLKAKLQ